MRENFPADREALRIVHYDSGRGLEVGWFIDYAFDEFWDYKYLQRLALPGGTDDLFVTADEEAKDFASRLAMIPLTRAMDTLVINISNKPSPGRGPHGVGLSNRGWGYPMHPMHDACALNSRYHGVDYLTERSLFVLVQERK